jgi:hypothetical protein
VPNVVGEAQETVDRLIEEVMGSEKALTTAAHWGESNGLTDEQVIEVASTAGKFRRAWAGDYSDFGNDASRGDAYVAYMLNWAGRDAYQTERIMRSNPNIARPKWDDHATYIFERTILGAVPEDFYTPTDNASLNVGGGGLGGWVNLNSYAAGNIKPIPQPVPNQIYTGHTTLIHSKPGKGKTLLAIYQAKTMLDAGLTVMYLDAENGPALFVERAMQLGITDFSQLHYHASPEPDLNNGWIDKFLHDVDNKKPNAVFLDSFADFLAMCGLNENDSMDVTRFFTEIVKRLRDRGIAVIILDHEPWEGRGHARGSTAKLAKVDVEWELRQTVPYDREHVGEISLQLRKDRPAQLRHKRLSFMVGGPDLKFEPLDEVTLDEGLILATESVRNTKEAIKCFGQQGATDNEWRTATEELGTKSSQYYNAKTELLRTGKVVKNNDTRRFIYSDSPTGVPEQIELRQGTGVKSTPDTESGLEIGEINSAGVKSESTGVGPLETPVTLRFYGTGE